MIRKLLQSLQRIETMYDLKSITEEQYAMMELMNDRLAHCIPKEKCRDYVTEAIACGQEAFEQYKDADIMAILVNSGVAILQDEREFSHHGQNYEVWAQITCGGKKKKIELFMSDLRRKQQILKENGVETGEQWLIKLHLAHEFYHFLEFTTLGKVGMRLDPVQKKTIFGTVQRPLTTVSEIAAHSFAGRYMKSEILPQMTDYMVMLSEGILPEETLRERMQEAEERLRKNEGGKQNVSMG